MNGVMKWLAAALTAVLVTAGPSSFAFAQTAPSSSSDPPPSGAPTTTTTPPGPTPSLPPGLPTVTPPTVPSTDPGAPPPEPEPPLPDPSPQVAILMAKITLLTARQVLDLSQAAFTIATAREEKVRGARDAAQHDYDIKKSRLTDAVSNAYVRGTVIGGVDDDYVPTASARLLVGTALQHAQADVRVATERLQIGDRALEQAKAQTSQAGVARDYAQAAFDDATDALSKAGRVSRSNDASPTVLGDAVLTTDELVGWYKSEGIVGYTASVDLPTLSGVYIDEAKAEHVRGDVAFAQSIVETGAFTSPLTTHNNFAGIGACDTCATGFEFPSPQMGVRAQVQLLHAYADKTLRAKTLANPPIGSDPDTLSVRGCCATWNALTGTWASDPNYGPKLMTVYLSMLEYTLVTRTQSATPPSPPSP